MDINLHSSQETAADLQANPDVIEPINRSAVHKICSGQVVLSLAIAVKELVENAVDASATNIDVRLKDYGSELLDVSDNGKGVRKENFQALTLKHYTSKLREFSDLESVETLGFRGEALSSLCALSKLTITTRHASAEYATKIQYDHNGKITSEAPAAREIGTTVTLENLFASLPVRRKEFTKNLKREYSKMCQLLYAYCLVSKHIKFMCTNVTKAGSRSTVVATEGSNTTRNNIISIFGARQIPSLIEVELVEPEIDILAEYKIKVVFGETLPFKFECIISSAMHGSGRSTSDRQFFYINSRPCEPTKIMKLVNEIYKQFNASQYPFVFLNIEMQRSLIDVNVTPDKRQIFLEKENLLLAVLKTSLLEAFKLCPSTYKVQNFNQDASAIRGLKRPIKSEESHIKGGNILDLFKKRSKSDTSVANTSQNTKQTSLIDNKNFSIIIEKDLNESTPEANLEALVSFAADLQEKSDFSFSSKSSQPSPEINEIALNTNIEENIDIKPNVNSEQNSNTEQSMNIKQNTSPKQNTTTEQSMNVKQNTSTEESPSTLVGKQNTSKVDSELSYGDLEYIQLESGSSITGDFEKAPQKTVTVRSSMKYVQEAFKCCKSKETDENIKVCFRSEIAPSANKTAEQELQKQISKDMFRKMDIIGQFNLGFIIAKLENDLFIIDQHATDEKYNFEQLQLSTVLESQVLVNPKVLELTVANEEILIEHIEVFQKNGFKFSINSDAPATKRVSLTAIPMSKSYIFGKDDIEEMLFMLQEDVNHAVCRPSRVRAMFASRACRKSVMIGSPLSHSDMRRLVDHMGEIDQPWNCPHGRPTMRHLINLKLVQNS